MSSIQQPTTQPSSSKKQPTPPRDGIPPPHTHPKLAPANSSSSSMPPSSSLSVFRLQKAITRYSGEDDASYEARLHAVEKKLLQDPELTHTRVEK